MYEEYYGLSACPFRLTPDRRFWFGSEGHRKAMSYLKYGLYQGEGFIVITGDVGTGKSTLISQLFEELDENDVVAATIGTTQVDPENVVRLICDAFGVQPASDDKASMLTAFEQFLVEQNQYGRRVLLVVDEAQNLPMRTLEELRMLQNFTLGGQPLFQIFLVGQPQFARTLAHPDLAQLLQRVTASYRLEPMTEQESSEYVIHRLEMVGWQGNPTFTPQALARIYVETRGVPRRINTLANRIMLFSALEELTEITPETVETVVADLKKEAFAASRPAEGAPESQGAPVPPGHPAHAAQVAAAAGLGPDPALLAAVNALAGRIGLLESRAEDHDRAIREMIEIVSTLLEQSLAEEPPRRAGGF
ncbi:XrtA/PEP-CTERM system-associated ATPase [Neomegalonema sp.]|uniref:XrtA/PEP-CTERM system-associated ATPase n=1 Tax=Neomegalonema sp. TaxID=2039713 RepID=UPI002612D7B4|nr:XrtA/PEP-CTERM system-associated ATPase [Neomegalonema sp.]MDD2868127.1 XrtA-associated ATPase [Neomegalonema sp.]